jgi:dTMP kinase
MKGKLIVFEGLDKSGKETQSKLLIEYLRSKGFDAVYADEPTSENPIGRMIKRWLFNEENIECGKAITLLYTADRYEHLKKNIIPNLESGKIVVLDRYYYSTMAYEKALYGVDLGWIKEMNKFVQKPDLVIFIDTDPEECIKRAQAKDRHEKLELLRKVKKVYDEIKQEEGFFVINGNRPKQEVFEDVKKVAGRVLKIG